MAGRRPQRPFASGSSQAAVSQTANRTPVATRKAARRKNCVGAADGDALAVTWTGGLQLAALIVPSVRDGKLVLDLASVTILGVSVDGSLVPLAICRAQGRPLVSSTDSDPSAIYVRFVAGTRYTFSDDSLLSLEYFFNGTGLDAAQFGDRQRLLDLAPTLLSLSPGTQLPDLLGSTDGTGGPLRFAFDTQRRHYLFLVYQRPHIADDFTVTATAIVDLEGPSAVLAPSLTWSAREWLNFTLFAFVPVGSRTSEFGSMPFRFRAMFEAKAFY